MARVMLLGDSIRCSYQALVTEALAKDGHQVWGPDENCQFSLYTLASLPRWLAAFEKPDVVHWNNGLHDVGHNPNRAPVQMPIEVYAANLRFIGRQLRSTGARVVWATTTPVHPARPFRHDQWAWRNSEIDAYNEVARKAMAEQQIPVDDLHAVVSADPEGLLSDDQLHLSEAGQHACADAAAAVVARVLAAR